MTLQITAFRCFFWARTEFQMVTGREVVVVRREKKREAFVPRMKNCAKSSLYFGQNMDKSFKKVEFQTLPFTRRLLPRLLAGLKRVKCFWPLPEQNAGFFCLTIKICRYGFFCYSHTNVIHISCRSIVFKLLCPSRCITAYLFSFFLCNALA